MTFEDARAAIYGRLHTGWSANYAAVPVEYQNQDRIDMAIAAGPFLSCEILFNDGDQASIEEAPMTRYRGAIYLSSWVRAGGGAATGLGHTGYLAGLFKYKTFGGVNTLAPVPMPALRQDGWMGTPLRVPFWFDDRS